MSRGRDATSRVTCGIAWGRGGSAGAATIAATASAVNPRTQTARRRMCPPPPIRAGGRSTPQRRAAWIQGPGSAGRMSAGRRPKSSGGSQATRFETSTASFGTTSGRYTCSPARRPSARRRLARRSAGLVPVVGRVDQAVQLHVPETGRVDGAPGGRPASRRAGRARRRRRPPRTRTRAGGSDDRPASTSWKKSPLSSACGRTRMPTWPSCAATASSSSRSRG